MNSWRRWIPVLILCAAVAVLFYRLLLGEVIYWGTPVLQFYPWRKMAFDLLRAGQMPVWNPLVGNGAPLLANYQTAVFYPPNWLYLVIPTEHAMGLVGLVHIVWAGLGMMVYLRRLGVGRFGQGVGALAFALNGYLIARFSFLSITSAAPWLPWLLWAVDGVIAGDQGRSRRRAVAALAGVMGMQLAAGHAQTTFYSLVLAGAYAAWRVALPHRPNEDGSETHPYGEGERGKRIAAAGMALGGGVLGVAVAAIQLGPTLELMLTSRRAGGLDPEFALGFSFWPWHFLTLVAPNLFGSPASGDYWGFGAYWEDAIYVGLLTLVMVGQAGLRWLREWSAHDLSPAGRVAPFFVFCVPPVFVLALGYNTRVFPWLFEHVPTFNMFQAPARWMLLAVFALSVLGGIGADGWRTSERGLFWTRLMTAGGVSFFVAAAIAVRFAADIIQPTFVTAMVRLGGTIILVGFVTLLLPQVERQPKWRPWWEVGALALLAADLVTAHWGLNPTLPADYYHLKSVLAEGLAAELDGTRIFYLPAQEQRAKMSLFLSFKDLMSDDRAHWDLMREVMVPNLGMDAGLPSASNFDPLKVGYYEEVLDSLASITTAPETGLRTIQQMNVGVLLTTVPYQRFELTARAGPVMAYRVPDPWPRAALAECTRQGGYLDCERIEGGTASISANEPTLVSLNVQAERAAMLVLTDTFYPGWQATVDGTPAPIQRANVAWRAVAVPAGAHEVVFTYRPMSLWIGAGISGVGLVMLAVLWWKRN